MDSLPPLEASARVPFCRTVPLRRYVLVALTLVTLVWALAELFAVRELVTRSYLQFERQDGLVAARRLDGFLVGEFERLVRIARDWGYWDETRHFVDGADGGYVARNMTEDVYENLAIDFVLIARPDGRVLHHWSRMHGGDALTANEIEALADRFVSRPYGRDVIASKTEVSGLLETPRGVLALAAIPVLDNQHQAAPAGYFMFGRDVEGPLLGAARRQHLFDAELFRPGQSHLPVDVAGLWAGRAHTPRQSAAPVDDNRLGSYVLLSDLDGAVVGVLRGLTPRDTKRRFEQMGRYLFGISLLLAGFIASVMLWLLERRVISPIAAIGRVVGRVARDGDLGQRIPASARRDELAQLGRGINLMLAQIATQQQLREARDLALAASAQKSEFLANMSHEIRTPMNGILGMLELVLETDLTSQQQERVQTAYRSARGLLALLNDILDLSKLDAGKLELERREFDLREVIENVVTLFAPNCEQKGLAIWCCVDPVLGRYVGDPLRVRQVVSNLLGNAVKFTSSGEIGIEVRPGVTADEIRLVVTDTGIGIAEARLPQLFQPFTQGDSSMARRYGGTGLGLAITRQLVERMQGHIDVDSTPGRGTRFICSLRLEAVPAGAVESASHAGKRAVVHGPDDGTRAALTHYLHTLGFGVERVAHEATLPGDVDLVVVDDTLGTPRPMPIGRRPAFLRLTSFNRSTSGLATGQAHVQTISKPVLWDKLRQAIAAAFDSAPIRTATLVTSANVLPLAELRGRRVLLVEDNVVNQALALGMLETYDLEIDCAGSGREALEKLGSARYDLVLMDCQMPEMDGLEATRRWREHEAAHAGLHVPIVALTANAMPGDRALCLAAGMDGYLAKPFSRAALTAALREWMRPSAVSCAPEVTQPVAPHAGVV